MFWNNCLYRMMFRCSSSTFFDVYSDLLSMPTESFDVAPAFASSLTGIACALTAAVSAVRSSSALSRLSTVWRLTSSLWNSVVVELRDHCCQTRSTSTMFSPC